MNVIGFRMLKVEQLFEGFCAFAREGTCIIVYDAFLEQLEPILLDHCEDLQAIRAASDTESEDWNRLDTEILEASIMLATMRNLCCSSLYWCSRTPTIGITPSKEHGCDSCYGLDFGEESLRLMEI